MTLPEIADRLRELAAELECIELAELAEEMRRRPSLWRAAPTSTPMTDELRDELRSYAYHNPDVSQAEIGRLFNVNPGRVSEALRGFRT